MAGDNQKLTRRRALCLLGAPVIAGATGVGFASAGDPGSEMSGMEHGTPGHGAHTGSAHAGFAGSGAVRTLVRLISFPFTLLYLLLYATFVHSRRALRRS